MTEIVSKHEPIKTPVATLLETITIAYTLDMNDHDYIWNFTSAYLSPMLQMARHVISLRL
jgi:hypothetical protein